MKNHKENNAALLQILSEYGSETNTERGIICIASN